MGRSGSAKRVQYHVNLPDDLMHVILSSLDFRDKINAGVVCKQWDRVLKAGSGTARHWVIHFSVNSLVSKSALRTSSRQPAAESLIAATERCVECFIFRGHKESPWSAGVKTFKTLCKCYLSDRQFMPRVPALDEFRLPVFCTQSLSSR
jgi:hypothetical protein